MKVIVDIADLHDAISLSVNQRSTMPILEHALFKYADGQLIITTTDTLLTRTINVTAKADDDVAFTGKVEQLKAATRGLEGECTLNYTNTQLVLSIGQRRFQIATLPTEEMPLPNEEHCKPLEIDVDAILAAIARVKHACARKDHRPCLEGVAVQCDAVVATDGHRVSFVEFSTGVPADSQFIIPKESLGALLTMQGKGGRAFLYQRGKDNPSALKVTTDSESLHTALIDSPFVLWRRTVKYPDECEYKVSMESSALQASTSRIIPFSAYMRFHLIAMQANGGKIVVSPLKNSIDTHDIVECDGDDSAMIGMNVAYLNDMLALAKGKLTWAGDHHEGIQMFTIDGFDNEYHGIMPNVI